RVVVVDAVCEPCGNTGEFDTQWVPNPLANAHAGNCAKRLVVVLFDGTFAEANGHKVVSQAGSLTACVLGVWYTESTWTVTGQVWDSSNVAGSPCAFQHATFTVGDLQGWGDLNTAAIFNREVGGLSNLVGGNAGGPDQGIGVERAGIRLVGHVHQFQVVVDC